MTTVESPRDRRELANDAGFRTISVVSVVAGTLVAFGFVAVAMAIAGAVGSQLGLRTEGVSTAEWRQAGIGGAIAAVVILFLAFFFGGYVAGRMARRAGGTQGLAVFVLALVVMGAVALMAAIWGEPSNVSDELASRGVPTDLNTWNDIGLAAMIGAGLAMLFGSMLGGTRGDRWHGRLLTAAEERRMAAEERADRNDEWDRRYVGASHEERPAVPASHEERPAGAASHDEQPAVRREAGPADGTQVYETRTTEEPTVIDDETRAASH